MSDDAISDCLGTVPDRPTVSPELVATEQADGFTRQTVAYEVEPGERVESFLLVPDGAEDAPGAVAIHQHAGQFPVGKSEPAGVSANEARHYAAALARRGYVVICPDLLGFEDRRPSEMRRYEGDTPEGADYEKFVAMDALVRGSSLQAKYCSDLAAAVDVLTGHDAVDADRIGTLGHSLGGQEALWLAWFDDRVRAAVASCGAAPLAAIQDAQITHNFAIYVPGLIEAGDTTAVLADAAPTAAAAPETPVAVLRKSRLFIYIRRSGLTLLKPTDAGASRGYVVGFELSSPPVSAMASLIASTSGSSVISWVDQAYWTSPSWSTTNTARSISACPTSSSKVTPYCLATRRRVSDSSGMWRAYSVAKAAWLYSESALIPSTLTSFCIVKRSSSSRSDSSSQAGLKSPG